MDIKYLYEPNRDFKQTRTLQPDSSQEIRSHLDLYYKHKSRESLIKRHQRESAAVLLGLCGALFLCGYLMFLTATSLTAGDFDFKSIGLAFFIFVMTDFLLLWLGGRTLWRPFPEHLKLYIQEKYVELILAHRVTHGLIIDIEDLHPPMRRIHFSYELPLKFTMGPRKEATFITASPTVLSPGDPVAVLVLDDLAVLL